MHECESEESDHFLMQRSRHHHYFASFLLPYLVNPPGSLTNGSRDTLGQHRTNFGTTRLDYPRQIGRVSRRLTRHTLTPPPSLILAASRHGEHTYARRVSDGRRKFLLCIARSRMYRTNTPGSMTLIPPPGFLLFVLVCLFYGVSFMGVCVDG